MKNQTYRMTMLYDFYGELLTDRQKEFFDLYYNEDLSLGEIAVNNGKAVVTEGSVEEMVSAEADAAVENGMLRLTSGGADTGFALQYHSRDVLVMTQDMGDGTSMSVYFERMTEEAEN